MITNANETTYMQTDNREDYVAVAAALHQYFDGLYHGDTVQLRKSFHPEAHYATASSGEVLQLDVESYLPVVAGRSSLASLGEPYVYNLEAIQFAGRATASVRMRSAMLGKEFTDFLSLTKVGGEWRIISKVFHYEPQPADSSTRGA